MPIQEVIQDSFLIIVSDVTLLFFILYNSTLSAKRRGAFLICVCITLIMIACNIGIYTFEGTGHHTLLRIFNAISYSVSGPVILPFIFLTGVVKKTTRYLLQILALLNIVLSVCSIFTNWIFLIDDMGMVHLGKLSPIPFYLTAMYMAIVLASSLTKYRLGNRSESLFLLVLCIGIIIAVILNTVFKYRFLISGMAVMSSVFYYLYFATQTLTRDALTNALNRHSFYKDIQSLTRHQMYVISMDLNGLKQINDTYGHDAGDQAILAVSDSVWAVLPPRSRFYRMGGDEFEILYPGANQQQVEQLASRIKQSVQDKAYSVAIGYREYRKELDFDEVFRDADAMMYDDKASMKLAEAQKSQP